MYGITGDALYEHFFIGLDASSNYMSAMITSAGGQLSSIDADGNFVYDAITETTSIDAAQRAYNVAVEGIETGSALFKGTAQADQGYTNTKMSKHQAAMVVGSTAGASYDFAYDTDLDGNATPAGAGRGEVVMLSAPTTLSTGDAEANIVQGPNLGAIDRSDNVSKDKDKEYYAEREDETKYFLS